MIAPLTRNLLILCAIVGVSSFALWQGGDKTWDPPAPRRLDPSLYVIPSIASRGADDGTFDEIVERPLFSASRRPAPPSDSVAEVDAEPDPFADVKVLGLFGSGSEGGAILLIDGKPKRVSYGETVGPWVLRSVSGMSARFTNKDGTQTTLEMLFLPQQASTAPANGAGAVPSALPANGGVAKNTAAPTPTIVPGQIDAPADRSASAAARNAQARAEARARRMQSRSRNQ